MIENGKLGAFACASDGAHQSGLTKREYFAGLAMQGILANADYPLTHEFIAIKSVEIDGELLKSLQLKTK